MISDIYATSILPNLEAKKAKACAAQVMNGPFEADPQLFQKIIRRIGSNPKNSRGMWWVNTTYRRIWA